MSDELIYKLDGVKERAEARYRIGADGADSVDCEAALAAGTVGATGAATSVPSPSPRETRGKTTLNVAVHFATAAATVVLTVVLFRRFPVGSGTLTPLAVQSSTATATSYRISASGKYMASLLAFDLAGASHYEIRCADPSAGAVDIYAWET